MSIRASFAFDPEDTREVHLEKMAVLLVAGACCAAGVVWSATSWLVFGWGVIAALPLAFVVVVGTSLIVSHLTRDHRYAIHAQIVSIVYIPALIQWLVGGLFDSGVVLIWALLGPLCALMFLSDRWARAWLGLYLANVVITVLFRDFFAARAIDVAPSTRAFFLLLNLAVGSLVVFIFARYYVKTAIREQAKANRLLDEKLQREILLRETRKLATLGKLSAGVAHELNNPASAMRRGASQLGSTLAALDEARLGIAPLGLSPEQLELLAEQTAQVRDCAVAPPALGALLRGQREAEMEAWLEEAGIDESWDLAPSLVEMGYDRDRLSDLARAFPPSCLRLVLTLECNVHAAWKLVAEIGEGAARVSEIVKSLKDYTYMDRAPVQAVDVHEGLETTLVMLRSRLKGGVHVRREFAPGLPKIEAHGSELNQVWTNLIDNAVDATGGTGEITIRTYARDSRVIVEIEDDGHGIPPEIQASVFDPFFTTKPPGQGTGLGLNVSHNIVTQKHAGEITVASQPGKTTFTVELPVVAPAIAAAVAAGGI